MKRRDKAAFHSTRRAGDAGTKALQEIYGEKLLYVRYYYNAVQGTKIKTAEIVVAEKSWQPKAPRKGAERLVGVKLALSEKTLGHKIQMVGGEYDARRRMWVLSFRRAKALGLKARIVELNEP